ncbi:MAG: hypothetical protein ACETVR_01520, partial [Candidatus Bathyarchaeia archaeon]
GSLEYPLRRFIISFFILSLLSSCYSSGSEPFWIKKDVCIWVNPEWLGSGGRSYTSFPVWQKVKAGSRIAIRFRIYYYFVDLPYDPVTALYKIGVNISYSFIQREEIIRGIRAGQNRQSITGGLRSYLQINFDELLSTGIIGLNFSYEGFYFEGDVKKTFTSEGDIYEVYLEVKESVIYWDEVIVNVAFIGVIVAILVITYRRFKKKLSMRLTDSFIIKK